MLEVEQASAGSAAGSWLIRWRIRNPDPAPLSIDSVWLPHSRFRGQEQRLEPPLVVPPADERWLDSTVICEAQPGEVVENAFLILRTGAGRIFVRLRVDVQAEPRATVEAITRG
jgi:hypothetical protein